VDDFFLARLDSFITTRVRRLTVNRARERGHAQLQDTVVITITVHVTIAKTQTA
jgi:hypothetical protein